MEQNAGTHVIKCHNTILNLEKPRVMGILNVTNDSFYAKSRTENVESALTRVEEMLAQGADIIDIGAYSTRPGAAEVSATDEWARLEPVLAAIRKKYPDVILSLDTFRSQIATDAVNNFMVDIVNDVSGGQLDNKMFAAVGKLGVPYVLMHMRGTPQTMQSNEQTSYADFMGSVLNYFEEKISQLQQCGVNQILIDPGFGFAKTLEQNYELFGKMEQLHRFGFPLFVGISRKSMIYKLLNTTAEASLNGTTVLNTLALAKGAKILRVHDVAEAFEAVAIWQKMEVCI